MAEVVANTGVSKDSGYLYYLGKDGNVWRTKMARGGKRLVEAQRWWLQQALLEKMDFFTT